MEPEKIAIIVILLLVVVGFLVETRKVWRS